MSDLILDMTPTTINRTAIYHIALDTATALAAETKAYRYGVALREQPVRERAELDGLGGPIIRSILDDEGLIRKRWVTPHDLQRRPSSDRVFFFDPLYALFNGINRQDVVLVLDLTPVTNPEWHQARVSQLYKIAFRNITASGARVAAISESSAMALWANYGLPYDKTTVVPLYLRDGVGAKAGDNPIVDDVQRVLLFVGSLETRKNISGLIRAFEASALSASGFKLKIVGGNGAGHESIRAAAQGVAGVELLGFVPDEALRELYRTSWAFVYPSYLEGFGVPILEAASWGLPILTSITGATAEVAPAGSVIVDPYDIGAIVDGLRSVSQVTIDRRRMGIDVNRKHANTFSFDRYISVIKRLIHN